MVGAQYSCKVARLETKDGCPLGPGASLNRTFTMKPLAQMCTHERGLALDAALSKVCVIRSSNGNKAKWRDTCWYSNTIVVKCATSSTNIWRRSVFQASSKQLFHLCNLDFFCQKSSCNCVSHGFINLILFSSLGDRRNKPRQFFHS